MYYYLGPYESVHNEPHVQSNMATKLLSLCTITLAPMAMYSVHNKPREQCNMATNLFSLCTITLAPMAIYTISPVYIPTWLPNYLVYVLLPWPLWQCTL